MSDCTCGEGNRSAYGPCYIDGTGSTHHRAPHPAHDAAVCQCTYYQGSKVIDASDCPKCHPVADVNRPDDDHCWEYRQDGATVQVRHTPHEGQPCRQQAEEDA